MTLQEQGTPNAQMMGSKHHTKLKEMRASRTAIKYDETLKVTRESAVSPGSRKQESPPRIEGPKIANLKK